MALRLTLRSYELALHNEVMDGCDHPKVRAVKNKETGLREYECSKCYATGKGRESFVDDAPHYLEDIESARSVLARLRQDGWICTLERRLSREVQCLITQDVRTKHRGAYTYRKVNYRGSWCDTEIKAIASALKKFIAPELRIAKSPPISRP